jgi:chromosome partitioning protein
MSTSTPRVVALINQKGGVGKTTSAVNIGAGLARLGKKVLLIDLDPQAHLTYALGLAAHGLPKTIYELLKGEAAVPDILQRRGDMDLLPSSLNLSGADIELGGVAGREYLLKEALQSLKGYHIVLIDCPPSLGLLTLNALTTARDVWIPVQTEFFALQGMSKLLDTLQLVQKRLNKSLALTGIIGTLYDARKNLSREVVEKIRGTFGDKLFRTLIRDNVALAEAPSHGKTIFEYQPASHGAADYLALCREIVRRYRL